jgi:hypothetical protein
VRWLLTGLLIGEVVPFTLIIIMPTNHKLLAISSDATSSETRDLLIRGVTPDGVERTNNEQRSRSASWAAPWFSSFGSDFKYDFGVATDEGETFGLSVSSATATTSITPTSPRDAASNSWSATSAISIWRRMVARRCGKTHSRVGRKPHSMNGSVTTIDTELRHRGQPGEYAPAHPAQLSLSTSASEAKSVKRDSCLPGRGLKFCGQTKVHYFENRQE